MEGNLPDYLKQGELARLIPSCAPGQKERAACSVLLAALRSVAPFARDFLQAMGRRMGNWAGIEAYTEVVFTKPSGSDDCRHDGLLILDTSRKEWRALVEAKIGTARVSPEQLRRYYRIAKANEVNAIITISNELTAHPCHIPYDLPAEFADIEVYHWSWPSIGLLAETLLREESAFDDDQHFILTEVVRYFASETWDIQLQMGPDWQTLVAKIAAESPLSAEDADVRQAVRCWHQQLVNMCIWLSRDIQRHVAVDLPRAHRYDYGARLRDDAAEFASSKKLNATFVVPSLAGPIELTANAGRRNLLCRLPVQAPERARYQSRLNWLLRQLPSEGDKGVVVHMEWDNGAKTSTVLDALRKDPTIGRLNGALPTRFEVARVFEVRNFSGPQRFIQDLDDALWSFYDLVARHIHPWVPSTRDEETSEIAEAVEQSVVSERRVIQQGEFAWGAFSVFDDGSIELDRSGIKQWFRNFAELERSLKANEATPREQQEPDPDASSGLAAGPGASRESVSSGLPN